MYRHDDYESLTVQQAQGILTFAFRKMVYNQYYERNTHRHVVIFADEVREEQWSNAAKHRRL
jgi:hypothetical protein